MKPNEFSFKISITVGLKIFNGPIFLRILKLLVLNREYCKKNNFKFHTFSYNRENRSIILLYSLLIQLFIKPT